MATPAHEVEVRDVVDLTARMRRVRVEGPTLRGLATTPAQEEALALHDAEGNPVRRRYTIRASDPVVGRWDIDVVLHGHGPGALWGDTVKVGDQLSFAGPRGHLALPPAAVHLLIADEAGLPAVAALLEASPADVRAVALLEVADAGEHQPLTSTAATLDVQWLHRDGVAAPGNPDLLCAAVAGLDLGAHAANVAAIVMAESKVGIAVRDALVARGVAKTAIQVKGYWNVGRDRPTGANR